MVRGRPCANPPTRKKALLWFGPGTQFSCGFMVVIHTASAAHLVIKNSRHSGSGPVRALAPACCVRKQDGQWQRHPLLVSYVQYFGARRRQAGSGVSRVSVPYQVRKPGPAAGTPNSSASRIPAHQPAPAAAPRLRSEADDCSTTTMSPTHWALGLGLPSSPRRRAASLPHRPPP